MNITESISTAWESIRMNKLRALLTMLGIIIGVASVIALLGIGNGFGDYIETEIGSVGTNLLIINSNQDVSDGYPTLSLDDLDVLQAANMPAVVAVAGTLTTQQTVTTGRVDVRATVLGVSANYFAISNISDPAGGRLFDEADVNGNELVVVLGAERADDLFAGIPNPIGETLRINGLRYRVIGVLTPNSESFSSTDDNIYIPISVAAQRLAVNETRSGDVALSTLLAQGVASDQIEAAIGQIADVLRNQHNLDYGATDDFTITSQASLLQTVGNLTGTLTLFLGAIAAISLLVGGIGIMNIMLVSVTERTREIGIRKAIGALRRDILIQFLVEALMISLVGGGIGIALGWTLAAVGGNLINVAAVVDPATVALATGFAILIGLVFGLYPAWRAAQLRPIEALRYE